MLGKAIAVSLFTYFASIISIRFSLFDEVRACLHGGGGPQIGERGCGGPLHLSCKRDQIKMSDYVDRRVTHQTRFQRFQIGMLESFLFKKNQKKILFLSKDIGGKRFFLVNYLY